MADKQRSVTLKANMFTCKNGHTAEPFIGTDGFKRCRVCRKDYITKQQQALLDWVLAEVVGVTPLINSHATAAYENLRQSQRQIIKKKKGSL